VNRRHEAGSRPPAALLQHVINSLADGVVVAGLDGRCRLANAAARRLLGSEVEDVPAAEWTSAFECQLRSDMVNRYAPDEMRSPVPSVAKS
jgi:PAS domain-containing protein